MNHIVPSTILISMLRYHLFGMGEEPLIVHIHPITDTGLIFWIFMNCVIDLGLSDLPFGPIWETRLRITLPAIIASFRAMVTVLWDRRLSGFELLGVNLCKPCKYNDDSPTQSKKNNRRLCQPMARERKAQHVDGRDVALDLIPFSRDVYQQEVYDPETYYSCFCRCLSSTIFNNSF